MKIFGQDYFSPCMTTANKDFLTNKRKQSQNGF